MIPTTSPCFTSKETSLRAQNSSSLGKALRGKSEAFPPLPVAPCSLLHTPCPLLPAPCPLPPPQPSKRRGREVVNRVTKSIASADLVLNRVALGEVFDSYDRVTH